MKSKERALTSCNWKKNRCFVDEALRQPEEEKGFERNCNKRKWTALCSLVRHARPDTNEWDPELDIN